LFEWRQECSSFDIFDDENLKKLKKVRKGIIACFSPRILRCNQCKEYKLFEMLKDLKDSVFVVITFGAKKEYLEHFQGNEKLSYKFSLLFPKESTVFSIFPELLPVILICDNGKIIKIAKGSLTPEKINTMLKETNFKKKED